MVAALRTTPLPYLSTFSTLVVLVEVSLAYGEQQPLFVLVSITYAFLLVVVGARIIHTNRWRKLDSAVDFRSSNDLLVEKFGYS